LEMASQKYCESSNDDPVKLSFAAYSLQ